MHFFLPWTAVNSSAKTDMAGNPQCPERCSKTPSGEVLQGRIGGEETRRICVAYIGDQDVPQTVEQEILYRLRASATDLATKDAERNRLHGKAAALRAWVEHADRTLAELDTFDPTADLHLVRALGLDRALAHNTETDMRITVPETAKPTGGPGSRRRGGSPRRSRRWREHPPEEGAPVADLACLRWKFRADGKQWRLEQFMEAADLGNMLALLGRSAEEVELEDLVGLQARIKVATFGGRTSASIKEVAAAADRGVAPALAPRLAAAELRRGGAGQVAG